MNEMFECRELVKQLKRLEAAPRGKLGRRALREGMKQFAAVAMGVAPGSKIRSAIKVRAMRRSRVRIGMMALISADSFNGRFYATFVELGHKIGKRATTVEGRKHDVRTGRVPGTHWERNAFRANKNAIIQTISDKLGEGLQDAIEGGGGGDS